MHKHHFFITVPRGLEDALHKELVAKLALKQAVRQKSGCSFAGSLKEAYRVLLFSSIAGRLLLEISKFPVADREDLYQGIKSIFWEKHFDPSNSLAVDAITQHQALHHSRYLEQLAKDAIVDRFREISGTRPSVDTKHPDIRINLRLTKNQAFVALDLSGESLHKRGYKPEHQEMLLKENLAAGLLAELDWQKDLESGGKFIDLMCGSGTLVLEAAMQHFKIPPSYCRKHFGFKKWKKHDPQAYAEVLDEIEYIPTTELLGKKQFFGFDTNPEQIRLAQLGKDNLELEQQVHFEAQDYRELSSSHLAGNHGWLVVNPPYGQRLLNPQQSLEVYLELERYLALYAGNFHTALLCPQDHPFIKHARGYSKKAFFNGAIPIFLLFRHKAGQHSAHAHRTSGDTSPKPQELIADAGFDNRLKKNLKKLKKQLGKDVICFRVYDRDIPEYALSVDIYQNRAVVFEYQPPQSVDPLKARLRLQRAVQEVSQVLKIPPHFVYVKQRKKLKNQQIYEKLADTGASLVAREGGLKFEVNLRDYLDTGLFLDQRLVRQWIGNNAAGKSFLNLFSYTSTASIYAIAGKASHSVSVDTSQNYLKWSKRNMQLNGFHEGCNHKLIQQDCFEYLRKAKDRFDIIFLAPPSFSNNRHRSQSFNIQEAHPELIDLCASRLKQDGLIIFTSFMKGFCLAESIEKNYQVKDVSRMMTPPDFQRPQYRGRCFFIS